MLLGLNKTDSLLIWQSDHEPLLTNCAHVLLGSWDTTSKSACCFSTLYCWASSSALRCVCSPIQQAGGVGHVQMSVAVYMPLTHVHNAGSLSGDLHADAG